MSLSFFDACASGNCEQALRLLPEADVNWPKPSDGATPLHAASFNGHKDVVQLLLDNGALPDRAKNDGKTPLYMASQNGHKDVVQLLLNKGASVDQAKDGGFTPLYIASQSGHKDVVQLLLSKGALVDCVSNDGVTPLFVASTNGHKDVVELLLNKGALVDRASNGLTPLLTAIKKGHKDIVQLFRSRGASVESVSNVSCTSAYTMPAYTAPAYGMTSSLGFASSSFRPVGLQQPPPSSTPATAGSSSGAEGQPSPVTFLAPSPFSQRKCQYGQSCFNPECSSQHGSGTGRAEDIARILRNGGEPSAVLRRHATRQQMQRVAEKYFHELYMAAKTLRVPQPELRDKMREIADSLGEVAEFKGGTVSSVILLGIFAKARDLGDKMTRELVTVEPRMPVGKQPQMYDYLAQLAREGGQRPLIQEYISVCHVIRGYGNHEVHDQGPDNVTCEVPENVHDKLLIMCAMILRAYQLMLEITTEDKSAK